MACRRKSCWIRATSVHTKVYGAHTIYINTIQAYITYIMCVLRRLFRLLLCHHGGRPDSRFMFRVPRAKNLKCVPYTVDGVVVQNRRRTRWLFRRNRGRSIWGACNITFKHKGKVPRVKRSENSDSPQKIRHCSWLRPKVTVRSTWRTLQKRSWKHSIGRVISMPDVIFFPCLWERKQFSKSS